MSRFTVVCTKMHEIVTRRKLAAGNQQFISDAGQHWRSFPDHFQKKKEPHNQSLHTYALWVSRNVYLRYLSHLILVEHSRWKRRYSYPHFTNEETVPWSSVTCLAALHSVAEPIQQLHWVLWPSIQHLLHNIPPVLPATIIQRKEHVLW